MSHAKKKMMNLQNVAKKSAEACALRKTIVTFNGSFDLLHAGHLAHLELAKEQGDVLVVGINSDASVRGYKGEKRPIIPEDERALLVAGLQCVDYVFLFDDADPRSWLPVIKPHVHVNSAEYGEDCVEAEVVKEVGARLHLLPRSSYAGTSDIIDRICERYSS